MWCLLSISKAKADTGTPILPFAREREIGDDDGDEDGDVVGE